jgi:uncharacterized protein (TIGR02301 family)
LTPRDILSPITTEGARLSGAGRDRRARFGDNRRHVASVPHRRSFQRPRHLAGGHFGLGQERDAGERQRLLDLAYTLGESHALRQACEGEADQYWRARMVRLTEVEQADQAFDAQLRERFNTGFASRRSEYPTCDDASRKAEQQAARKGQALARSCRGRSAWLIAPNRRRIPWRTTKGRANLYLKFVGERRSWARPSSFWSC